MITDAATLFGYSESKRCSGFFSYEWIVEFLEPNDLTLLLPLQLLKRRNLRYVSLEKEKNMEIVTF